MLHFQTIAVTTNRWKCTMVAGHVLWIKNRLDSTWIIWIKCNRCSSISRLLSRELGSRWWLAEEMMRTMVNIWCLIREGKCALLSMMIWLGGEISFKMGKEEMILLQMVKLVLVTGLKLWRVNEEIASVVQEHCNHDTKWVKYLQLLPDKPAQKVMNKKKSWITRTSRRSSRSPSWCWSSS